VAAVRQLAALLGLLLVVEPPGLFVGWNRMHDRRPGRLAFIPLRALAGGL
jgi:hypothetical protein